RRESAMTIVSSGQTLTISSGQTDTGDVVLSSGAILVYGAAVSTQVMSWGQQDVYSGGVAVSTTINNGGAQYIFSGGTASNTTINSGAYEQVGVESPGGGGRSENATVYNGGLQTVTLSGLTHGTTLSGGTQQVLEGGAASGT